MRRLVIVCLGIAIACAPPQSRRPSSLDPQREYTRALASDSGAIAACEVMRAEATTTADPVYLAGEVDRAAADPSTRGVFPMLPPEDADVIAVAIVRQDGHARPADVRILRATSAAAGAAVKRFLDRAPFTPAQRDGVAVSQCIVVPITSRVSR